MLQEHLAAITPNAYKAYERQSMIVLVSAGLVSLLAIAILAGVMMIKALQTRRNGVAAFNRPLTHVTPYFVSLLTANTFQAVGSISNIRWVVLGGTLYEPMCFSQGTFKNIGNVGTSLWALIIAFHAFDVLFLRNEQSRVTVWATVIGIWAFILFVDIFGPAILENPQDGPFFGVSGYWCWISSGYPRARIFLEYIFMFLSAVLCAFLHSVVFLRLRGNLSGESLGSIRFRRIPHSDRWVLKVARDEVDGRLYKVAMQLMWYPLSYTLLIIPIAIARFVAFAGYEVSFTLTLTADFFFNLNGLVNVIIFGIMYRRISLLYLPTLAERRKSLAVTSFGVTPFVYTPPEDPKGLVEAQ